MQNFHYTEMTDSNPEYHTREAGSVDDDPILHNHMFPLFNEEFGDSNFPKEYIEFFNDFLECNESENSFSGKTLISHHHIEEFDNLIKCHAQLLIQQYCLSLIDENHKKAAMEEIKPMILDLVEKQKQNAPFLDLLPAFMEQVSQEVKKYESTKHEVNYVMKDLFLLNECQKNVTWKNRKLVATFPPGICKLADPFREIFDATIFPQPPAKKDRKKFTDSEDRLLTLGVQKYGRNFAKIREEFLPAKKVLEIANRKKNTDSRGTKDHPPKQTKRKRDENSELTGSGQAISSNNWHPLLFAEGPECLPSSSPTLEVPFHPLLFHSDE